MSSDTICQCQQYDELRRPDLYDPSEVCTLLRPLNIMTSDCSTFNSQSFHLPVFLPKAQRNITCPFLKTNYKQLSFNFLVFHPPPFSSLHMPHFLIVCSICFCLIFRALGILQLMSFFFLLHMLFTPQFQYCFLRNLFPTPTISPRLRMLNEQNARNILIHIYTVEVF